MISILFGLFNVYKILRIKVGHSGAPDDEKLDFVQNDSAKDV